MTPSPTPITIAVSDPVSANIQAVAAAVTATCNLLCTPAGQQLLVAELKVVDTVEQAAANIFGRIYNALHKFLTGK